MNITAVYGATFQVLTAVLLKIRFFWDSRETLQISICLSTFRATVLP